MFPPLILLCTSPALGGIELNVLRLAVWMRARGHTLSVACASGTPLHARAAEGGIPVVALGPCRSSFAPGPAARLHAALRARPGSVCVINLSRDIHLATLARAMGGVRTRLWYLQHMQIGRDKRDPLHRWEYARLERWIAPLPWLAAQARARTAVPPAAVTVVPLGIDLRPYDTLPSRADARRALDLPRDADIVCTVGRFDEGKGQEYLVAAAAALHRAGRRVDLLLMGEDTRGEAQGYGARLAAQAAALGVDDRVHFRPFQEDVRPAYAAADVFALTSLAETYGMVTIEAMAAGLPVVGTSSGGTPEILRDGDTGILVPPRDADALARAITTLLDDRVASAAMGARARGDALRRFSHESQCAALEALMRPPAASSA